MEMLRRVYRVFRWAVLAALVVALVLILWTASPPNVADDPQASRRLESKLRSFAADAGLGLSHPLRLDEAEVNSWMKTNLALASKPGAPGPPTDPSAGEARSNVRDVRVHLAGDRITAWLLFDLHGKELSLTIEGGLSVQDGYLRLSPDRMRLGSLPIPRAIVDRAIGSLFDSPRNHDRFRLPPDIRNLRVENGEMVLTLR
jgi:hypothetical protein